MRAWAVGRARGAISTILCAICDVLMVGAMAFHPPGIGNLSRRTCDARNEARVVLGAAVRALVNGVSHFVVRRLLSSISTRMVIILTNMVSINILRPVDKGELSVRRHGSRFRILVLGVGNHYGCGGQQR